ncbi:phage holin family protein [Fulvivirga lutea]|uniref:Phage holin family protein n=1 Tax=Fulvivirga lutea TaxID=2810512 RepID=A0A974WK05_9BACT|nr:phage holin family protein [Fulvivirga lutea]QSE98617.1 phage holin family protein [Fulvivirga lutea]
MSSTKGIWKLLGFDGILDNVKALVDTRVKLIKLEIKDELAKALANTLISIILLNLLFFALLLVSVGVSIYIGREMGNYFQGFLIVSAFYFILFVVLMLFKKKIGLKEAIERELNKIFGIDK